MSYCPWQPNQPGVISQRPGDTPGTTVLSWSAANADSAFPVEYRLYEAFGSAQYPDSYYGGITGLSKVVTPKLGDGSYRYKVQSCNIAGCGNFTPDVVVSMYQLPGTPGAISGPSLSSSSSYSLSWTAASGTVSRYDLYENGNFIVYSGPSLSATVTGKGEGTNRYTVQACNVTGCGPVSAQFAVTVLFVPGTPGPITGPSNSSTGEFALGWGASTGSVSRYELYENGALAYSGTAISVDLAGRTDGLFQYQARACNASGCSGLTAAKAVSVLHPPGAPGAIAGPSTSSTGSWSLTWGAAAGAVSRYDLYENSALVASGTALSNGFTGKPDGTYRYQVQACNAAGCGVRTPEFDVTALLPPGAPGALVGPSTSATGAYTLSWGAASGTVSRYDLYENGTLAYSAPGASAGLVGRTDGTYRYRVQACNALSCGAFGAEFDIAVAIPPNAPGAPGPIAGPSSSTTGAFALGWGAASGVVSRYDLYENGVLIQSSPALTSSLSGRRDGSYHYRVQACNSGGCGLFTPELVVNVLLIPPAPAPIFASTATTTSGAFTIGWTAPSGYTVDGYRLERSYAGGAWTTIDLGAVASYDDKQLVDGVYSYRVSARNASGVGPPAGPVSVTVSLQLSDALPDHPIVSPSVPGQQWLGTLAGRASVDGGEATYQIGIDVPPGRAGMEPTLGLTYKSRGGNGIAGVGWSLAGSSTIYRCPRTLEQDGAAAPVRLTSDDWLCFDGQRLVAATGSYGASGSEYRTEIRRVRPRHASGRRHELLVVVLRSGAQVRAHLVFRAHSAESQRRCACAGRLAARPPVRPPGQLHELQLQALQCVERREGRGVGAQQHRLHRHAIG